MGSSVGFSNGTEMATSSISNVNDIFELENDLLAINSENDDDNFFVELLDSVDWTEPTNVEPQKPIITNNNSKSTHPHVSSLCKDITRNYRRIAISRWLQKRAKKQSVIKKGHNSLAHNSACLKPNLKRCKENGRFVKSTMNFIKISEAQNFCDFN
jgi:hypothetical protein